MFYFTCNHGLTRAADGNTSIRSCCAYVQNRLLATISYDSNSPKRQLKSHHFMAAIASRSLAYAASCIFGHHHY